MIKYFETYCDINECGPINVFVDIAQQIEKQQPKKLFIYHPRGYIFLARQKLLNKEIELEDFFILGEPENKEKIFEPYPTTAILPMLRELLNSQPTIFEQNMIIISQSSLQSHPDIYEKISARLGKSFLIAP